MAVSSRMSRIAPFVAGIALAISASAFAGQQTRNVLPPINVATPSPGITSASLMFDVQWPAACPCTLTILNGGAGSEPRSAARVFVGWAKIDGATVLTPVQLSLREGTATASVNVAAGRHRLQLDLVGRPTSFVTVSVSASVITADLIVPRAHHTATLMPDGTIFVAGGENRSGVLSSAERIDAGASAIAPAIGLTTARAGHSASLVPGLATIVAGGRDATGAIASIEVFSAAGDPIAGQPLDDMRSAHTATALRDGRVLIVGGVDASGAPLASAVMIDPRPDPFTDNTYDPAHARVTSLGTVLQVARAGHTATLLPDGRVLIAGGRGTSGDVSSIELLDPDTGASVPLPITLGTARSGHSATLRSNGDVLIIGGQSGTSFLSSIEIIAPSLTTIAPGGNIALPRAGHTATTIRGGEILIAGGTTATGPTANTELGPVPPADIVAPSITMAWPVADAVDVDRGVVIGLQGSEAFDPVSINASTAQLRNGAGEIIAASVGIADQGSLIAIAPEMLLPGGTYSVTVNGVTDRTGLPLPSFSLTFAVIGPPVITALNPMLGPVGTEVSIIGSGFSSDVAENHVSFGGTALSSAVADTGTLLFAAPSMPVGGYAVSVRTRGGLANAPVAFQIVNPVPSLTSLTPETVPAGSATLTLSLTGENFISDASVEVGTTALSATVVSSTSLHVEVPASLLVNPASLPVRVINPAPGGGASNTLTLVVESVGPPPDSISLFPRGMSLGIGGTQQFTAQAHYADGSVTDITNTAHWTSSATGVVSIAANGVATAGAEGTSDVSATFIGKTALATIRVYAGTVIPPNPVDVAPDLKPLEPTTFADSTRFLYEGANAIQRDVAPGTMETQRVGVVRGTVHSRDAQPIPGVRVTIKDHPEFGYTLTRLDGAFDMAVNGGGSLVVVFTRDGYLPIERRAIIPSGVFETAADAVLIPLDTQVTEVNLLSSAPMTMARGSVATDAAGSRQATVMFPAGTTATMVLPDGSTQPLNTLHVRATEYTVGSSGPAAMPGTLPTASGYTYAAELSADEAVAAGATSIQFSSPLPLYVENFLGFPIGAAVPIGYYDRKLAAWVPSNNGVVLKVLSIAGDGRAEIDSNGDAQPDDETMLAALGMTDTERRTLATTYTAGQSLWRVAVTHFTPWDHNWPMLPPADAKVNATTPTPTSGDPKSDAKCEAPGSIIECQDQVLGERLPITGTPFTLNYRSDRVPGRNSSRLSIPLNEGTLPASVERIDLEVSIAGRTITQSFPGISGQVAEFSWDGRDAYGRLVEGEQQAEVSIRHMYRYVYVSRSYLSALNAGTAVFGLPSTTGIMPEIVPARELTPVTIKRIVSIGPPPASVAPIAGWSIDVHHTYLPESQTVLFGDGNRRNHAGKGISSVDFPDAVEFFHDKVIANGAIYYIDDNDNGDYLVFKKVANEPAVEVAPVPYDVKFAVDPSGNIYYGDCLVSGEVELFQLEPGGSPVSIATAPMPAGERCRGVSIARAQEGTIFLDTSTEVFQRLPGGPLVGIGGVNRSSSIAVGPDGSVYRAVGGTVERLDPSGAINVIAGGVGGVTGGGGLALNADLGGVNDVAVTHDGSVLIVSQRSGGYKLQQVTPGGRIYTIAGGIPGAVCCAPQPPAPKLPDGTAATSIRDIFQVEVGDDGWVYLFSNYTYRFRPFLTEAITQIAADDGSEIYEFNGTGRHLRTLDALTGATRYTFSYDAAGQLATIVDADGLTTQVERDGDGVPTAIVAPFGQTTALSIDANGWLSQIAAPGGRITTLTSTPTGLLTNLVDANQNPYVFTYDDNGRLQNDSGPAGGSETLARTLLPGGAWETSRTSAMRRVRRYKTEIVAATGAQLLTITAADGTVSTQTTSADHGIDRVDADGTRTTVTMGADPRFGFEAPVAATTAVRLPSGLTMTVGKTRTATLIDQQDPSTLVQTDTTTINFTKTWRTVFTGASRTLQTTSPVGRVTTTTLDAKGRVVRTQVGGLTPIDFTYDAQGRLKTTTQGTRTSSITYDDSGRASVLTDALLRTVSFGYDAADRVNVQTLPDTRTIGFDYDNNSNVTSLTPPGRPAHTFTYTPIDFTASYTPPAVPGTGSTGYVFNADRQPTEVQRPDGQTTLFTYGQTNGRLNSVTFSRGLLNYGYDTAGRIGSLSDPGGVTLTYLYDGSVMTRETWSGGVSGFVNRTFNQELLVSSEQVGGTSAINFTYDNDQLLTAAGALAITRHPQHGLVTSTTLGTTTDTYTYSEFGEPARQTSAANGTQVFDVQITRDDLGRITQRIEVVDGITRVFQYGYDLAGRLENVTRNGTLVVHYTYDANGNRLSAEGEAGLFTGSYDDQDRLTSYGGATYTYTANGELASKTVGTQTTSYVYDTLGNLIRVTKPNGTIITYTVDGRGRRVAKAINGVRVKGWLYADQLRPIAELTGTGAVLTRFVYGAKSNVPEYMIRSGVTYRIFSDHLGSPRVVVNQTTGQVVQRMDFQAFGEIIQDSNPGWQPFGFAGGLYDPDSGLIRFGVRDFDPQSGRWTANDPIQFLGGQSNLRTYAFSDPVNRTDPNGKFWGWALGAVVGGVSGASGAYLQGGSAKDIAIAAGFGALAGAYTAANTTSALALGLVSGLADAVGQLVGMIGCPTATFNPASTIGAVASGLGAGTLTKALTMTPGFAAQSPIVQEISKAMVGLGTSAISVFSSAAKPQAQGQ